VRRARTAAVLALALAACRCGPKPPPDAAAVAHVGDPYPTMPPRMSEPDWDRAVHVLEAVGAEAGYGAVPASVLRLHRGEGWAHRLALLLATGGTQQLQLAHRDLVRTIVEGARLPTELRSKAQASEARMSERAADGMDADTTRRALLAEIAYCLYAMGAVTPDSGY